MSKQAIRFLGDARDFAIEAGGYAGLPVESYRSFEVRAATSYAIILIHEALRNVPADVLALNPDIPAKAIRDMRNVLVHTYWEVDFDVLMRTINEDIEPLISALDRLLGMLRELP